MNGLQVKVNNKKYHWEIIYKEVAAIEVRKVTSKY